MTDLLDQPLRETWRTWSGLLVPPLMWGARLLATWTVAQVACNRGWALTADYYTLQTAITLSALILTLGSGWAAWSVLRGTSDDYFDPPESRPFLALTGVVSAVVFSLLIVLEGSGVYLIGCR